MGIDMKKLLIILLLSLFCSGCISANVAGFGFFELDPGVRVYKSDDITVLNITHKENGIEPDYDAITELIKGVFTE